MSALLVSEVGGLEVPVESRRVLRRARVDRVALVFPVGAWVGCGTHSTDAYPDPVRPPEG